jgi:secreted Zn-dependent insulinase-like peptidase
VVCVCVVQVHHLDLTWVLPELFHAYLTKPTSYIDTTLGHEGEGTLFSFLRRKGWATSLMAGPYAGGQVRLSVSTPPLICNTNNCAHDFSHLCV